MSYRNLVSYLQLPAAKYPGEHASALSDGLDRPWASTLKRAARLALKCQPQHRLAPDPNQITGPEVLGGEVDAQVFSEGSITQIEALVGIVARNEQLPWRMWAGVAIADKTIVC